MTAPKRRSGFLIVGTILGSCLGWAIVQLGIVTPTATDRFWYTPGRSETWVFCGTMIGATIGFFMGIAVDLVVNRLLRK
jgi:hypothetical protein